MQVSCDFVDIPLDFEIDLDCRNAPFAISKTIFGSPKGHEILTNGEEVNKVYEVELGFEGSYLFEPGDSIGVFPENPEEDVGRVLEKLGLVSEADKVLLLKKAPKFLPVTSTTIRRLLTHYLDLRSPSKKGFLKVLVDFVENHEEKHLLQELSLAKSQTYSSFIQSEGRTFLGLLDKISSCKVPFSIILTHLPGIKPRVYSICCKKNHSFGVAFNVISGGLCSNFLEKSLFSKRKIAFYFRQVTKFRVPRPLLRPLVLIGTGTGVAPFKGFLQEIKTSNYIVQLYFGCRFKDQDFLYGSFFKNCLCLTNFYSAFSRDLENPCYVQKKLLENSKEIVQLFNEENCCFYLCGNSKMIKEVQELLNGILGVDLGGSEFEDRFIVERWT